MKLLPDNSQKKIAIVKASKNIIATKLYLMALNGGFLGPWTKWTFDTETWKGNNKKIKM